MTIKKINKNEYFIEENGVKVFSYILTDDTLCAWSGDVLPNEELFINEVKEVSKNYKNLWFSCIKKNWIVIVDLDPYIIDYSYTPILSGNTLWSNIKRIFNFIKSGNYSIKKNAELNNPTINQELISCNQLHFMDYIK